MQVIIIIIKAGLLSPVVFTQKHGSRNLVLPSTQQKCDNKHVY